MTKLVYIIGNSSIIGLPSLQSHTIYHHFSFYFLATEAERKSAASVGTLSWLLRRGGEGRKEGMEWWRTGESAGDKRLWLSLEQGGYQVVVFLLSFFFLII